MSIDKAAVRRVARLARLKLAESEEEVYASELTKILGMIAELDGADTDGVEPLTSVVDMLAPLRPDRVTDGGQQKAVTANAPEETAGFFVVQKIVE